MRIFTKPVPAVPLNATEVADATPSVGVTKDGEVAKTSDPLPVSLVIAVARLALVGVPNQVATPVPSAEIPVPPLASANVPALILLALRAVTL